MFLCCITRDHDQTHTQARTHVYTNIHHTHKQKYTHTRTPHTHMLPFCVSYKSVAITHNIIFQMIALIVVTYSGQFCSI